MFAHKSRKHLADETALEFIYKKQFRGEFCSVFGSSLFINSVLFCFGNMLFMEHNDQYFKFFSGSASRPRVFANCIRDTLEIRGNRGTWMLALCCIPIVDDWRETICANICGHIRTQIASVHTCLSIEFWALPSNRRNLKRNPMKLINRLELNTWIGQTWKKVTW